MGKFYFYSETNYITTNDGDHFGNFGPLVGGTDFRVTDLHNGASGLPASTYIKAFAVTDGIACVFPSKWITPGQGTSSELVNIVIKPNHQPDTDIPKIKYFVYRGIRKDSLVYTTGLDNNKVILDTDTTYGLLLKRCKNNN
ncbi:hypothetical protein BH10BAC1_BH10BAC1_18520 [soil metagenome]